MTRKPTGLAAAVSKKAAVAAVPEPEPAIDGRTTRTLTLRLPPLVHEQLREMSYASRRSQHALLMEGLNLLFERHGKPPIAPHTA
jgi:hypothetical protein